MKKLMIALGVVACAAAVQASSYKWAINTSDSMMTPGGANYYTGTGYLFEDGNQAAVLAAYAAGTDISTLSGMLMDNDIDEGDASASGAFDWGSTGDTLDAFYAAILKDGSDSYIFISDVASQTGTQSGSKTIKFTPEDDSSGAAMDLSKGYTTAGWYTAVPEPTSGLLLLLGVAGLALRRRRA